MNAELKKLTNMHQHLQQKMYNTTLENKKLKLESKKFEDKQNDQNYLQTYAIDNLEKMLSEARKDNAFLV